MGPGILTTGGPGRFLTGHFRHRHILGEPALPRTPPLLAPQFMAVLVVRQTRDKGGRKAQLEDGLEKIK